MIVPISLSKLERLPKFFYGM